MIAIATVFIGQSMQNGRSNWGFVRSISIGIRPIMQYKLVNSSLEINLLVDFHLK